MEKCQKDSTILSFNAEKESFQIKNRIKRPQKDRIFQQNPKIIRLILQKKRDKIENKILNSHSLSKLQRMAKNINVKIHVKTKHIIMQNIQNSRIKSSK